MADQLPPDPTVPVPSPVPDPTVPVDPAPQPTPTPDPVPTDPPPVDPQPVPPTVPDPTGGGATPDPTTPVPPAPSTGGGTGSDVPQAIKDGLAQLAMDLSDISAAVGIIIQTMQANGPGNVVDPADLAGLHTAVDAAATDASNLNNLVNGTPTGNPVPPTGGGTDLPPGTSGGPVDQPPPDPTPAPTPDPVPAPDPSPTPDPTPAPAPTPTGKLSKADRDRITADEAAIDSAQADIESTLGP